MRAMKLVCVMASALIMSACQQLPSRTDLADFNKVPTLQGTFIASQAEIRGNNLILIPGLVCVPTQGVCQADFAPGIYLKSGAQVSMQASLPGNSPAYRALINDKYEVSGNFPFIKPSSTSEALQEVELRIVATASAPSDSFPGAIALRDRLSQDGIVADEVFWVAGASIVSLSKKSFLRVANAASVTGTGFGFDGKTYNGTEVGDQTILIGLDVRRVRLPPRTLAALPGGNASGANSSVDVSTLERVTYQAIPLDILSGRIKSFQR